MAKIQLIFIPLDSLNKCFPFLSRCLLGKPFGKATYIYLFYLFAIDSNPKQVYDSWRIFELMLLKLAKTSAISIKYATNYLQVA